jgi:hypothetical protein
MDLPVAGWYPDPYGTPSLLRWWDGARWTQHTHPDTAASGNDGGAGEAVTRVQGAAVKPTAVQPNTGQPNTGQPATVRPTTVQSTQGQPSADVLRTTRPPTGPPTQPQPALPDTPFLAETRVQSPVPQTAVQQAVPQTRVQPATGAAPGFTPDEADDGGTKVLFFGGDAWQTPGNAWQSPGDAWQAPGGPGGLGGPGGPGGPVRGNQYGYQEAQRRRRRWQLAGLTVGTAAAVGLIAVIVANLGSSPASKTADETPVTPSTTAAKPSATPSTPSPTASATPTGTGSVLSDGQSGLSYSQLASPWQGTACPSSLGSGSFTWTAGEYAVAGQVNGGQTTWYGEACSGPLPLQYGYNGVADLENTAVNLANSFQGSYYNTLAHTAAQQVSEPVRVGTHAGWEVTYLITYTNATAQGLTWTEEQAAVVVADTGTGNEPAVFFTSIPGNLDVNNVTTLVSSLTLSALPTSSSSPTGSSVPSDAASDGGNGGNGGNPNGGGGNGGGGGGNNP